MRPVNEDFDVTFADIERRAAEDGHSVCDEDGKPLAPIPDLIRCAINGSEHKKLCVGQIVDVLEQRFPRWGLDTKGQKRAKNDGKKDWRNTVRHTLTSRNDFFQVARPAGYRGRGNWWKIDPQYAEKGLPLRRQTPRRKTGKSSKEKKTSGKSPSPARSPSASRPSRPPHSLSPLSPSPPPRHAREFDDSSSVMDVELSHVDGMANAGAQTAYAQPAAGAHPPYVAQDGVYGPTPPLWPASTPPSDTGSGSYVWSGSSGMLDPCASRSRSGSTSSAASGYLGFQHRSHVAIALPSFLDFGDLGQYAHPVGNDMDAAMRHLSLHSSAASTRARSGSTSSNASSSRRGGLSIAELVD